jgi:hypothetical protein
MNNIRMPGMVPVANNNNNNNTFLLDMANLNEDGFNRASEYIRRHENHLIDIGNGEMVADDAVPRAVDRLRITPETYDITALDMAGRYVNAYRAQNPNNNGGRSRRGRNRRGRSRRGRSRRGRSRRGRQSKQRHS